MRVLNWDKIKHELDSNAAFNLALLRAIDPRMISHRPRDPEKKRLMSELGMETRAEVLAQRTGMKSVKKKSRRTLLPDLTYE